MSRIIKTIESAKRIDESFFRGKLVGDTIFGAGCAYDKRLTDFEVNPHAREQGLMLQEKSNGEITISGFDAFRAYSETFFHAYVPESKTYAVDASLSMTADNDIPFHQRFNKLMDIMACGTIFHRSETESIIVPPVLMPVESETFSLSCRPAFSNKPINLNGRSDADTHEGLDFTRYWYKEYLRSDRCPSSARVSNMLYFDTLNELVDYARIPAPADPNSENITKAISLYVERNLMTCYPLDELERDVETLKAYLASHYNEQNQNRMNRVLNNHLPADEYPNNALYYGALLGNLTEALKGIADFERNQLISFLKASPIQLEDKKSEWAAISDLNLAETRLGLAETLCNHYNQFIADYDNRAEADQVSGHRSAMLSMLPVIHRPDFMMENLHLDFGTMLTSLNDRHVSSYVPEVIGLKNQPNCLIGVMTKGDIEAYQPKKAALKHG